MSTQTTNYHLVKPADSEAGDISVINTNMDTIDTNLKRVDNHLDQDVKQASDVTFKTIHATDGVFDSRWNSSNDYAEYFPLAEGYEKPGVGEVVAKHPGLPGYCRCLSAAARGVVGVVTASPVRLGGPADWKPGDPEPDNFIPVGLAGRVPVYVIGPCEIGDYLIPADIPGAAQAVKFFVPGCIMGKALEAKTASCKMMIEMLIVNM